MNVDDNDGWVHITLFKYMYVSRSMSVTGMVQLGLREAINKKEHTKGKRSF